MHHTGEIASTAAAPAAIEPLLPRRQQRGLGRLPGDLARRRGCRGRRRDPRPGLGRHPAVLRRRTPELPRSLRRPLPRSRRRRHGHGRDRFHRRDRRRRADDLRGRGRLHARGRARPSPDDLVRPRPRPLVHADAGHAGAPAAHARPARGRGEPVLPPPLRGARARCGRRRRRPRRSCPRRGWTGSRPTSSWRCPPRADHARVRTRRGGRAAQPAPTWRSAAGSGARRSRWPASDAATPSSVSTPRRGSPRAWRGPRARLAFATDPAVAGATVLIHQAGAPAVEPARECARALMVLEPPATGVVASSCSAGTMHAHTGATRRRDRRRRARPDASRRPRPAAPALGERDRGELARRAVLRAAATSRRSSCRERPTGERAPEPDRGRLDRDPQPGRVHRPRVVPGLLPPRHLRATATSPTRSAAPPAGPE